MQVKRGKDRPLYYEEDYLDEQDEQPQPQRQVSHRHAFSVAYVAIDRAGGIRFGASTCFTSSQERAKAFALEYAHQSLPANQGFRNHTVEVWPIEDRKILELVASWS